MKFRLGLPAWGCVPSVYRCSFCTAHKTCIQKSEGKSTRLLPLLSKPKSRRLQQAKRELTEIGISRSSNICPTYELRRLDGAGLPARTSRNSRASNELRARPSASAGGPAMRSHQPPPPPCNSSQGAQESPLPAAAATAATTEAAVTAAAASSGNSASQHAVLAAGALRRRLGPVFFAKRKRGLLAAATRIPVQISAAAV